MKTSEKTRKIVLTAVMIAIMLVLQLTGIGLIDLGVIRVTLYCTIIAIGTLVLGWDSGMILGAAFTAISFWSAVQRPSAMVAPLMEASPIFVFIMSFIPRMLVPFLAYLLHMILVKAKVNEKIALGVGAAAGSLCNTILYLGLMLLGYALTVADYPGLLAAVGAVAGAAGVPEAIIAGLVTPPVVLALRKIYK